jgi:hypothetical protein
MLNLSDKEIDRLSREASDSYEPDDSSLSWSRLEQKLAQQMPERPPDGFRFGRINPYIWSSAIILVAGTSFFLIKNAIYNKHSTRNIQTVDQTVLNQKAAGKNASENTIHLDSVIGTQGALNEKNSQLFETNRKSDKSVSGVVGNLSGTITPDSYTNPNTAIGNNHAGASKSSLKAFKSSTAAAVAGTSVSDKDNAAEDHGKQDINGMAVTNGAATQSGTDRNKNQISLPYVITNGGRLGKVSGNDSLMNRLAQSKTPIHQQSLHLNRSLNIGFTFGPDYTNAGGIASNQIGNNIGLTIGYYLTDKISINTGFIYSNKFYWSEAHNYFFRQTPNITPTAYTRNFAAPPPIDYINGASNIWELPLTLRYDFAHYNKTKFFANAGFSSYFMMKQTYIYFIHSGQNQLAYKISDDQQKNYWFGIADMSVGFEAEIGKGFSFQAEPFLKLPLQNMGTENLKLTSYGFLMTFKYAPVLSRTRK